MDEPSEQEPDRHPSGGVDSLERIAAEIGIVAVCGVIAALLGFTPTPSAPLGFQMAIGIGGFLAGWSVMRVLAAVGSASARVLGANDIWGYLVAIPVGSALITWTGLWIDGGADLALGSTFARTWPSALLVGLAFFLLFYFVYRRMEDRHLAGFEAQGGKSAAEAREPDLFRTPLHARLPLGFPRIIALSAEDHYVRVIGDGREELVLISMSEATALMPPDTGLLVHRSWWVARSSVVDVVKSGRDSRIDLENGLQVPVARGRQALLKEEGVL
ncbi:MAG: LytTR family DNA-binding domain-containing protein [Erythrobacter sp.]